eukprot:gene14928-17652_t
MNSSNSSSISSTTDKTPLTSSTDPSSSSGTTTANVVPSQPLPASSKKDGALRKATNNMSKNSNNFFNNIKSSVSDVPAQQQSSADGAEGDTQTTSILQSKPRTFVDGVLKGIGSVGAGIVNGAKGIVEQPYRGAKKEGPLGFAKGVAKGISGAVLLPFVGVCEFVSMTTQGVINTPLTVIDAMKRTDTEGLFRLSGSKVEIDKLHIAFDKGEIIGLDQMHPHKVHEISGLFKAYFRFLPESIVPEATLLSDYGISFHEGLLNDLSPKKREKEVEIKKSHLALLRSYQDQVNDNLCNKRPGSLAAWISYNSISWILETSIHGASMMSQKESIGKILEVFEAECIPPIGVDIEESVYYNFPYHYQPAPIDKSDIAKIYINFADHPLGQSRLFSKVIGFHEGIPGHHLQISASRDQKDIDIFRKNYINSSFYDGWGFYAESLSVEYGWLSSKWDILGHHIFDLRVTCKLIIDTSIHYEGLKWDTHKALSFLHTTGGFSEEEAQDEIEMISAIPGIGLSEKIGELKIRELRELCKSQLKQSFNVKAFHTLIATHGASLPMDILYQMIERIHESAYYTHTKPLHWMNVASIQKLDFEKSVEIQKRLLGWFSLGLSLAPLLSTDKGPAFVRALVQLMEEYDYHYEMGSAMQGVKVLLSKKQQTHTIVNENDHIKSKIVKIGNTVIYEFLKIFNIAIAKDLDYFHVVFSLLEILEQIYKKFDKETCSSKYVYEAILKVDSRLKHQIFGFLAKEIDKIAAQTIREQLEITILSTSTRDRDIQQHQQMQSKLANSLSSSNNGDKNNSNSYSDD